MDTHYFIFNGDNRGRIALLEIYGTVNEAPHSQTINISLKSSCVAFTCYSNPCVAPSSVDLVVYS